MEEVSWNADAFSSAPEEVRGDGRVMMAALLGRLRPRPHALEYGSAEVRSDRCIVMAAVRCNGFTLEHASEEMRKDPCIVMAAVYDKSNALQYASREMQNDWCVKRLWALTQPAVEMHKLGKAPGSDSPRQRLRNIMLAAVAEECRALEFASVEARDDDFVVLAAILQNASLLKHASPRLRADRTLVMAAVSKDWSALEFAAEEARSDWAIVMMACSDNSMALQFASKELRSDQYFMVHAISQHGGTILQFASPELRSNRYVVMAALNKDALALEYASPGFRNDPSVVMAAVCRNPDAFKFASDNLRKDPHIVMAAFDPRAMSRTILEHAAREVLDSEEFGCAMAPVMIENGVYVLEVTMLSGKPIRVVVTQSIRRGVSYVLDRCRTEFGLNTEDVKNAKLVCGEIILPASWPEETCPGVRKGRVTDIQFVLETKENKAVDQVQVV